MRRHGAPYDYPDIPGPSGLSEEYVESLLTPAIREAIARRQAALSAHGSSEGQDPILISQSEA